MGGDSAYKSSVGGVGVGSLSSAAARTLRMEANLTAGAAAAAAAAEGGGRPPQHVHSRSTSGGSTGKEVTGNGHANGHGIGHANDGRRASLPVGANGTRGGKPPHPPPPHPFAHVVSYDEAQKLRQQNASPTSSDDEQTAATSDMTGSTESMSGGRSARTPDRNVYKSSSSSSSSRRRLVGAATGAMRRHHHHKPSSSPHHVPKGLRNVGNTCYANAALQCLLSTALTHALLDPTQALIFRRYSSNQNILAQGSGSVDSADMDYEYESEIGLTIDEDDGGNNGGRLPHSPSEEEKAKKREERRLKKEAKRKEKEKAELRETCRWLTGELTDITRDYTTFRDPPKKVEPPPSGLFGGFLTIAGHTPPKEREAKVVDPGTITRNVHKLSCTLRPYQQEDAHEFLRSLLSTLTMEGQNRQLSALFDGLLESSVTCQTCGYASLTRDRYMDLSLDISDASISNLTDALRHFTKTETLDENNKVDCRKCQERQIVTKGLRLATAPTILVCHLKRFAWNMYGQQIRLSKDVAFPLQLDIDKCMSKANRSTPPPYQLVGVLVHTGRSCDSGHYYSFVRSGDRWYKCNDATVTEVNVDVVLKQKAYMLIYEVEGMRKEHDCESYGKYHPEPKPAPPPKKSSSFKKTSGKRKMHVRSQSAPRPFREPSPVRNERFPFASPPLDTGLTNDGNTSEANGSAISETLASVFGACLSVTSLCGTSGSYIPEEVRCPTQSWDPEADSQCSADGEGGVTMQCLPSRSAASCCTDKKVSSEKTRSTKTYKPPLSPPRTASKKSVRDAMISRGQSTGNLPSLASSFEADGDNRATTKPSRPKETAPPIESSTPATGLTSSPAKQSAPADPMPSPSPSKASPSKASPSKASPMRRSSRTDRLPTSSGSGSGSHRKNEPSPSKKHRRRKKKHHSHFPMADDYTGSDSEDRGQQKLKGIDILKKKSRDSHRRSKSSGNSGKTDRPTPLL
mmetsp:Transcript_10796/g.30345  ORF Transcript_10796/g.30345 Transcript_10796/m.30345 type:complete len:969 (-) Transcript_10796:41-2947(-)